MSEQRHGGWLLYKCRECGIVYGDIHVPDMSKALLEIMYEQDMGLSWDGLLGIRPNKVERHFRCQHQGALADFVGVVMNLHELMQGPEFQEVIP